MITPTPEQQNVIDQILNWAKDCDGLLTFGGYAGTGKTSILRFLLPVLSQQYNVGVVSLTGKACSVLRSKGLDANTIHSTIYDAIPLGDGRFIFKRKEEIEPNLIINDEASMTSSEIYNDLSSLCPRILAVGDHGQLPPISKDGFNLMDDPDLRLETIHRQAEGSPILTLAHRLRTGRNPLSSQAKPLNLRNIRELCERIAAGDLDQIICALNRTRNEVNTQVRSLLGRTSVLEPNDKVICLRNNAGLGLFNGLQGIVVSVRSTDPLVATIRTDDDHVHEDLLISFDPDIYDEAATYWAFGWCITAHKAQGSEWPNVGVIAERLHGCNMARWGYTAATRASRSLTYLAPVLASR